MVNNWLSYVQNALFPSTCLLCRRPGHARMDICVDCYRELPWCTGPDECPPQTDRLLTPFDYRFPVDALIKRFKFQADMAAGRLLGDLVCAWLGECGHRPAGPLIPVPSTDKRLRTRGFCPASQLARNLARRLGAEVEIEALRKRRETPRQAELGAAARRRNLRNVFAAKRLQTRTRQATIVDDVVTTGTTAAEAAATLRTAGMGEVLVLAAARA